MAGLFYSHSDDHWCYYPLAAVSAQKDTHRKHCTDESELKDTGLAGAALMMPPGVINA